MIKHIEIDLNLHLMFIIIQIFSILLILNLLDGIQEEALLGSGIPMDYPEIIRYLLQKLFVIIMIHFIFLIH